MEASSPPEFSLRPQCKCPAWQQRSTSVGGLMHTLALRPGRRTGMYRPRLSSWARRCVAAQAETHDGLGRSSCLAHRGLASGWRVMLLGGLPTRLVFAVGFARTLPDISHLVRLGARSLRMRRLAPDSRRATGISLGRGLEDAVRRHVRWIFAPKPWARQRRDTQAWGNHSFRHRALRIRTIIGHSPRRQFGRHSDCTCLGDAFGACVMLGLLSFLLSPSIGRRRSRFATCPMYLAGTSSLASLIDPRLQLMAVLVWAVHVPMLSARRRHRRLFRNRRASAASTIRPNRRRTGLIVCWHVHIGACRLPGFLSKHLSRTGRVTSSAKGAPRSEFLAGVGLRPGAHRFGKAQP